MFDKRYNKILVFLVAQIFSIKQIFYVNQVSDKVYINVQCKIIVINK